MRPFYQLARCIRARSRRANALSYLPVLMLTIIVGVGTCAYMSMASPSLAEPDDNCVSLSLQPASRTIPVGGVFTLDVRLDAGTAVFESVSLDIRFDPTLLTVVDTAGNPTGQIQQGNLNGQGNTFVVSNAVDNNAGAISYTEGYAGRTQTGGTFTIATIRFKAKQLASSTSVSFGNVGASSSLAFTGVLQGGVLAPFCSGSPANAIVQISALPTATPTPSPTSRPIATVFIQPANALVPVNTWTTMDVRVANAANLQSANVRLTFDPAIFQVEDADIFRAGLQVSAGDCFPAGSTVGPTVQADNGAGTITFAATRGGAAFTGTCTIASIRFRAVRGGLSPLAFSVAPVLRDPTQAALSVQSSNALMTVPRPYLRYFPFVEQARSAGFVGSP